MRFWQYTVAVGLAGLVFAVALVSEFWQLQEYVEIDQIELSSGVVDATVTHTDQLLPTGEFVRVFVGADFSENDRLLKKGKIFVGGTFFAEETIPRERWLERGMVFEGLQPAANLLRVGPVLLYFPSSNVLVERDDDWGQTSVWVFGHSVELWFPGARRPFVIPSTQHITIRDSLINNSTHELYYSKLRKDFQLKSFEPPENVVEMQSMEQCMRQSLLAHQKLRNSLRPIAWDVVRTWSGGAVPTTVLGVFLRGWHRASLQYALGVPAQKKDTFKFRELVAPLVEDQRVAAIDSVKKIEQRLRWFRDDVMREVAWQQLLDRSDFWQNQWRQFALAQKLWLPGRAPGTGQAAFSVLWQKNTTSKISSLQQQFSAAEVLLANKFFSEAISVLKQFSNELQTVKITSQNQVEITKFRRILTAALKQHVEIQRVDMFELLGKLVEIEAGVLAGDVEFSDEIQLEVAQDLLYFIGNFLDNSVDTALPQLLLNQWRQQGVASLSEKYGREIFSSEEKNVLQYISLAGRNGVGKDEIKAIQSAEDWRLEMEKLVQSLILSEVKTLPEKSPLQDSARNLAVWLGEQLKESEWVILSQTNEKWRLAGKKDTVRTLVTYFPKMGMGTIEVGDEKHEKIAKMMLPRVIRGVWKNIEAGVDTGEFEEVSNLPAQTTPKAILERRYLQHLLLSQGFQVNRSDVLMLTDDASMFRVEQAEWMGYRFQFEFMKSDESIQNLSYFSRDSWEEIPFHRTIEELIPFLEKRFGMRHGS